MANQLPLLENLTLKDVQDFRDACVSFDAKNILGTEYEDVVSYSIPRLSLSWKNKKEFERDIKFITGAKSIIEANKILEKKYVEVAKNTEEKPIDSNRPDVSELEQLEKEAEKRSKEIKETTTQAEKSVRQSLKRKEEIYKQQRFREAQSQKTSEQIPTTTPSPETQEKIVVELKDEVVYAAPEKEVPEIQLNTKEAEFVELAKNDPEIFSQKLSELIVQQNPEIPQETLVPLAQTVAADTTQALIDPTNKTLPTGVFASIASVPEVMAKLSPETISEVGKSSAIFASFSESQQNLYRSLLNRAVGQNITNSVLGLPDQTYVLTNTPSDNSYKINLDRFQNNSFSFQQSDTYSTLNNPLSDSARSLASNKLRDVASSKVRALATKGSGRLSKFATSRAFDNIAPLIGMKTNYTYVGTGFLGKTITKMFPQYAPLMSSISSKLGINIGIQAGAPERASS